MKITVIVIIGIPIIYFSILASTGILFNHHYKVGNFNIYSDSEINSPDILIEKVNSRVISCEIFKENLEHNIYISSSEKKFSFFAKITGSSYPGIGKGSGTKLESTVEASCIALQKVITLSGSLNFIA